MISVEHLMEIQERLHTGEDIDDVFNDVYELGRADARAEIHTELITEIAMLNETKMTDVDLYVFAVRIKEITDKLKVKKNE